MAKILIVESDDGVKQLLINYFAESSEEVTAVSSAEEALDELSKANPAFQFVITENQLPNMKGTELILRINDLFPKTHIIFMSGSWNGPLPQGIAVFHEKPFDVEEIGCAVRRLNAQQPQLPKTEV